MNESEFGHTGAEMSDVRGENLGYVPDCHKKSHDDEETGIGDRHQWKPKILLPTPDVRRGYAYSRLINQALVKHCFCDHIHQSKSASLSPVTSSGGSV